MGIDDIPRELKEIDQWVCVKNKNKIPYQADPNEWPASVSDQSTWCSFYGAVKYVKKGIFDGVGFVFNSNGIVGIDIDDGFVNGRLSKLTYEIFDLLPRYCYIETSRSGRGFHILLKGTLPIPGRNNHAGLEIYDRGRYFIMTGKIWDNQRWLVPAQEAIDKICEKYFPDTPRESGGKTSDRIYKPVWDRPDQVIPLRPHYPPIPQGSRNICLASLAGVLHSQGYLPENILRELDYCNNTACTPPLPVGEVYAIVKSITRYKRE